MRVLHLWDEIEPSWFDHSFAICREEGIEVELLCMRLLLPTGKTADGVQFVRKIVPDGAPSGPAARLMERVRRWIDARQFKQAVTKAVDRFQPDVIHCHYGTTAAILAPVLQRPQHPLLISFYGYDISQGVRDAKTRAAYRQLMALGPLVHVLCDEAASRAVAFGCPRDRIVEANLPLPVDRYPFVGGDGEIRRWLIPARFVEKKGHGILLQAFARHVQKFPDHCLTCWGGYGDPRPLHAQVEALGLPEQVTVVDNRKEGPFDAAYLAQLKQHDVVLAPSVKAAGGDDEGGPALTAVLAQVAGKPVIMSDFPGHERSLSHGVEGLVVPQGDADALAKAMAELASNSALAKDMGVRGRERAISEFSREAYRDALLGWYRRLAA